MLYFAENKHDCTGCGACTAACPVHCISMQKDEEGFLYPIVSGECVHCGKCEKVCPVERKQAQPAVQSTQQIAFCALTKNQSVWKRSASGGAFTEICRAFGDRDTIVCGAEWDGLRVHHVCVEGVEAIAPLCKSKYLASDIENVFLEIKEFLSNGKKVVFCGTPCQVAGLKNVVGNETDRLLLIDLICHGVGSPDVFAACMDRLGEQFGGKVQSYEFRAKRTAYENDHIQRMTTGSEQQLYLASDPYIQLFLTQTCLRPSCGKHCRFRCERRQGDITIADFKGLTSAFPALIGTKRNYSSVIFNTPKGAALLSELRKNMKMYSCDIETIKKYNPLFYRQTWFADTRDAFFSEFIADSRGAIDRFTKPAQVLHLGWKRRVWMLLPSFVRRMILAKRRGGGAEFETCAISKITVMKL